MESVLLRENKFKTEKECDNLMKMLRSLWLEPVLKDLQDPDNTDFMMLESRLRSAYIKLDSDFREEAPGPKSLCYNLAYVYDLVGYANLFLASEKHTTSHYLTNACTQPWIAVTSLLGFIIITVLKEITTRIKIIKL